MLVPSPMLMATSSPSPGITWSHEPDPTKTLLPTAMRPSPESRTGGWMTLRDPNPAKAPEVARENAFAHARDAKR